MAALRVLVADPCVDTRETLAELLRLHGHAAEPVPALETLAARLRDKPADAVVTEFFHDPEDTCSVIRAAAPGVRIAFYTAWAFSPDSDRAAALRCRHFAKPDGVEGLVGWLADLATWGTRCRRAGGRFESAERWWSRGPRALYVATVG